MGRVIPYVLAALALWSYVQLFRARKPGEPWFASGRRWWLVSAVLFTVLALLMMRVLRF